MKLHKASQYLDNTLPFNIWLKCKIDLYLDDIDSRKTCYKHNYSWKFIRKRHETSNFNPMKYKHICYF
jgi:hypothetical protein